jgi:hypothetical protein
VEPVQPLEDQQPLIQALAVVDKQQLDRSLHQAAVAGRVNIMN